MIITIAEHTITRINELDKITTTGTGNFNTTTEILRQYPKHELASVSMFHFNECIIYLRRK